jgi:hypothetical protein
LGASGKLTRFYVCEWERSNTMEEIVEKPASIADLERLEADIEEALISHIDKPADESIIADLERRKFLERRKLHLICEIERLRRQYCVPSLH